MRRALALSYAVAHLILVGCVQPGGSEPPRPKRESLTIQMPHDPTTAQERVQRAAVDGGWVVTQSQPGLVVVGPYGLRQDNSTKVTLTANIVRDSTGARIVVRGVATDGLEITLGGGKSAENRPIVESTSGRAAWKWLELQRFAAAIESAGH